MEMAPGDEALVTALEAKENLSPDQADALDWRSYNERKLVVMRCKGLKQYEQRNFWTRTMYDGKRVIATETGYDKIKWPMNRIQQWLQVKFFANVDTIGVSPSFGSVVSDGQGARLPELCFFPDALTNRPGVEVCNTRREPWSGGVITIAVARTLPELLEDSKFYFTDPKSLVNFCVGIKVYVPTQQMVAFLRVRVGAGTQLTWAVSFGTQPIGPSTLAALEKEGVQVLGLNVPCASPGIPEFKLVLNKEWFFPGFPPGAETSLGNDVELDFFAVQQWCLGSLTGDPLMGPQITPEEADQVKAGMDAMMAAAWAGTGIWYAMIPAEKRLAEQVARQVAAQFEAARTSSSAGVVAAGTSSSAGAVATGSSSSGAVAAENSQRESFTAFREALAAAKKAAPARVSETPEQIAEVLARAEYFRKSTAEYDRALKRAYREALAASAGTAPASSNTRSKSKKQREA